MNTILASLPPEISTLLICLGIGFVIALIATGIMKGQLKSVRSQSAAAEYVKQDSLNVTESHDLFLYRNITRRPKPKSNNSGSGRSGNR